MEDKYQSPLSKIEKHIENMLAAHDAGKRVLIVSGGRQWGKTAAINKMLKEGKVITGVDLEWGHPQPLPLDLLLDVQEMIRSEMELAFKGSLNTE